MDPESPPSEFFLHIYFVDENLGYASGYWIYSDMHGTYQYGILRKTTNGGVSWSGITLNNVPDAMQDVYIAEGQTGYVAGHQNKIYKSTNAGYTALNPVSSVLPKTFTLHQNYPNPFNPTTKIKFEIPAGVSGSSQLKIYDILGREVRTVFDEVLNAGVYEINFDAGELSGGVYFYRLVSGLNTHTKKMILIK